MNYDYIALEDKVRRSGLLTDDELLDLKRSLYKKTIFVYFRRKIPIEDFDSICKTKDYYNKISSFIEENKVSFKF